MSYPQVPKLDAEHSSLGWQPLASREWRHFRSDDEHSPWTFTCIHQNHHVTWLLWMPQKMWYRRRKRGRPMVVEARKQMLGYVSRYCRTILNHSVSWRKRRSCIFQTTGLKGTREYFKTSTFTRTFVITVLYAPSKKILHTILHWPATVA